LDVEAVVNNEEEEDEFEDEELGESFVVGSGALLISI
jgi:hypothetical protein